MQNYKEINGNDYVKDSRTTINETMRSIQSMNSGTAFPTTNLFEGMKCYRTDLKKTYTLTDVENNTWVEDDIASKLSTARKINITGNATGAANFDGSGDVSINVSVNESKHAGSADTATRATAATTVNATAPNGGAADLVFGIMANDDSARIRVGGSTDNGWLEIATADGGNEPIYARQYSGPYDWPNGRPGTVTNEAAILDSNGNTKFPKNVTAASFTGPLNGNAATADRASSLQTTDANGAKSNGKFYWVGKDGQPMWLWGSNTTPSETYVYNPSHFHVAAADNDGNGANIANTYVKKAGDTVSGDLTVSGNLYARKLRGGSDGYCHAVDWGYATHDRVDFYEYGGIWNFWQNTNTDTAGGTLCGSIRSTGWNGNVVGNVTGNASTATNADKLDGYHASDIINRITAANTGGIVVASLTENGYVKFANGLILQWGSKEGSARRGENDWYNCAFPIAFSAVPTVIDGNKSDNINNITKTGFDMLITWNYTGRYIAIGI